MLKIRFVRIGKKNKPFFRIAVGDSRRTPKGKFIEKLGYYNPLRKEKSVNKERVLHWISNGAQCSDTVHNLLVSLEIIKGPKRKIKIKVKKSTDAKATEDKKPESAEKPADDKAMNGKNKESEKIEKPANASDKNTEEKKEDKSEMKTEEVKEEIKTEGAKAPADDKIVADEKKEEGKQEK